MASADFVNFPPSGYSLTTSLRNSEIALSATGFLLGLCILPGSNVVLQLCKILQSRRACNPGAVSIRIVTRVCGVGLMRETEVMIDSSKLLLFSFKIKEACL